MYLALEYSLVSIFMNIYFDNVPVYKIEQLNYPDAQKEADPLAVF